MILSSAFLLPPFFLQLLASSAVADGYPIGVQNQVIRRSSHTPDYGSLPQLLWRRCMDHEGDNCRGLAVNKPAGTHTLTTRSHEYERELFHEYDDGDNSDYDTLLGDHTTSDPTETIHRETETETPIPTTELMQATRESASPVKDELDDDEVLAATPATVTQVLGSHGTFLPRHSPSTCSHGKPEALCSCGTGKWGAFFRNTSSSDLRKAITPELVAVSMFALFLLAVLIVEVSQGLWRLWNSERFVAARLGIRIGPGQVRLMGPERTLLAVPNEDFNDEVPEYGDLPSGHDREKQDMDES